ncbi:hypothetical protein BCR42DRAFT_418884 [Absidia repens]|uniref:Arb2 domain-containing protein n=1 Tax=Absidia repens TaxID=90262 RepID=A0A1X2ICL0_9FUNG|nr:hypothetical protein BCR42DRAFT_418884 [Absidia repens]
MFRGKRKAKKENPPIPITIDDFGYVVKDDGTVRSKTTDLRYEFSFDPKDHAYNESRYRVFIDLLGDIVEERLQQTPLNFQKVIVPEGADPSKNDPHTYFYMTPNALKNTGKLVLLIPGTQTRVGQWSKRVMCDESLQAGSMINMAKYLIENDHEVIIFNPNGGMWYDNAPHDMPPLKANDMWSTIPGSESPEQHCQYVFRHFVRQAQAEKIGVIALGYGGHCFTDMINENFDIVKSKVVGVALANSTHLSAYINGQDKRAWMINHVVNWVLSDQPKGEDVPNTLIGCTSVSSGPEAELPEYVLWKCAADMMNFIGIKMGDIIVDESDEQEEESTDAILADEELAEHLDIFSQDRLD